MQAVLVIERSVTLSWQYSISRNIPGNPMLHCVQGSSFMQDQQGEGDFASRAIQQGPDNEGDVEARLADMELRMTHRLNQLEQLHDEQVLASP